MYDAIFDLLQCLNALQFVSVVRTKLNEKQKSSVSEAVLQPIIEDLKDKYTVFKQRGYDYFGFLHVFSTRIENFTSTNSVSKDNKLVLHCDFSQCCIRVPDFEIYTTDEEKQVKVIKERKKIQQQKELARMKMEGQKLVEGSLRLGELKFKKAERTGRCKTNKSACKNTTARTRRTNATRRTCKTATANQ
jgi:hypothetical protein